MFRFECEELTSHDDLPPEILRRLQVEQLWARRNVLADFMNADRFKAYAQRRSDPATGCTPMGVASRDKLSTRAAIVVPMRNRKSFAPAI